MHRPLRKLGAIARLALAWARATIDLGDVLTLIGLGLVGVGLWRVSPAAALAVPGAIVIWFALPPRPPFISQRPRPRKDV